MVKISMAISLPTMAYAVAWSNSVEHIVSIPMHIFKGDCGKKSHLHLIPEKVAMLQESVTVAHDNVPGAGITPFKAFETVLKDGFMKTACVKDYMYYRGDKFGDNKFDYKLGPVSNVSIVHYDEVVAKEDRQEMTQKVCFEFCRTVPNMGFFGMVNGRNCYCTPYFEAMASDSSQCDANCPGDNTLMCGGKSKSSIFTMHMCASTKEDLNERSQNALSLGAHLGSQAKLATGSAKTLQDNGELAQVMFGKVGDSAAADHAQAAKVWAGTLEHSAEDAEKIVKKLNDLVAAGEALKDFTKPETVTAAERIMEDIDETSAEGEMVADELEKQNRLTKVPDEKVYAGAGKEYYPAMWFVDKKYADNVAYPSTCTGELVAKPILGSLDACASACDSHIHDCVGFQFFSTVPGCNLLSSYKTAFYYTDCEHAPQNKKKPSFLQQPTELLSMKDPRLEAGAPDVTCYAKLSKFEGTTLAVDGSGKCKQCFKELTKADRCPWK